ncbi:MAG: glycosyltransferase [Kiritimatiellia bacterium]|nr:glycosyltransferase [Kiritimatiellia bacterium]MDP6631101.1 glycosyltransferase [Kiritimatiellia bacterium]MDP6810057.1 glycosyltransferase [Kiritimatiellia bacterium]MDP7024828.1 glycosyltransferase [Kiritimatiellia bacterium]
MDITLIIPVFNEEPCITATIEEAAGVLDAMEASYEIITVDDGSTDRTGDILTGLMDQIPALRVISLQARAGQTAAFSAGFRQAHGTHVVLMDADGQNDPADIPRLIDALQQCDACCGYRRGRKDTIRKRIAGVVANAVRRAVLHDGIRDSGCSLKAIKRSFASGLPLDRPGMHRFIPALLKMRGATIHQLPVNHRPRSGGQSKYTNRGRLKQALADLFTVRRMLKEAQANKATDTKDRVDASLRSRIQLYRRYWRTDLILAAALIIISIVLSQRTIDLEITRWFFARADPGWPDPTQQPWQWLYDAPPLILAVVIPACMVMLLLSALHVCGARARIRSIYLLLALWLGAGLIVEGIFKMNWGRPKPAQLIEFGGWLEFHSALVPGEAGRGRSFPSGHSAIGYYLTAFYFLLRRDRPRRAFVSLLGGLAIGTAIGLARIRVGGHFASDVAWSAAVMFSVNLLVYYFVLNVPAYEDGRDAQQHPRRPWGAIAMLVVVPALIQALVLTISPVYRSFCHQLTAENHPEAVRITTAGAEVDVTFVQQAPLRIEGELLGRGFAGAAFSSRMEIVETHGNRLADLQCSKSGWFFRSGGRIRLRIPADQVTRLTLDTAGAAIHLSPHSLMPTNTVIDIRSGNLVP